MGLIKTQNIGMGDWLGKAVTSFWNRSGFTLTRGQVAMCDIINTSTNASTFKIDGVETDVLANLTILTQLGVESGSPVVVCIDDSVPNNSVGRFLIFGRVEVATMDADISTNDGIKGGRIVALVSDAGTSVGGRAAGAAAVELFVNNAGSRVLGQFLEDASPTSATGPASDPSRDRQIDADTHLRWAIWTGGLPVLNAVSLAT